MSRVDTILRAVSPWARKHQAELDAQVLGLEWTDHGSHYTVSDGQDEYSGPTLRAALDIWSDATSQRFGEGR